MVRELGKINKRKLRERGGVQKFEAERNLQSDGFTTSPIFQNFLLLLFAALGEICLPVRSKSNIRYLLVKFKNYVILSRAFRVFGVYLRKNNI